MDAEDHRYPLLQDLVHSYFHQDYESLTGSADDVIREYREFRSAEEKLALTREIESFIALYNSSDKALSEKFVQLLRPDIRFYLEENRSTEQGLRRIIRTSE